MVFKRIVFFLMLSMLPIFAHAQEPDCVVTGIHGKMQDYMTTFPQSQLRDVYKFCFQDFFGLEHILSDSAGAARYIEYELSHSDTDDWNRPLFFYPLTIMNNYVRVDLNYVRKGIIPLELMVSAMLQSSVPVDIDKTEKLEYWKAMWRMIEQCLNDVEPRPLNFELDSMEISQQLSSGQYAMHHSKLFNETYRQHYRIIRRDVFDRLLHPHIVNSYQK